MIEDWKPLPYAPKYLVSSIGRVQHTEAEQCRKTRVSDKGYVYVNFWAERKLVNKTVHGLVAELFIGPHPDGMQVCHKDGNRSNNSVDNLYYGTGVDNARDRDRHGNTMRGERNGNSKISDATASEIRSLYEDGVASQYELARRFSISQAQINNIVLGKQRRRAA